MPFPSRCWFLVALLCCWGGGFISLMGDAAPRAIVPFGTTTNPNLVRVQGFRTLPCPVTHPYAMSAGMACCAHANETLPGDLDCGGRITISSLPKCCTDKHDCLEEAPCRGSGDGLWSEWGPWADTYTTSECPNNPGYPDQARNRTCGQATGGVQVCFYMGTQNTQAEQKRFCFGI